MSKKNKVCKCGNKTYGKQCRLCYVKNKYKGKVNITINKRKIRCLK